jgi:hypothetical protein
MSQLVSRAPGNASGNAEPQLGGSSATSVGVWYVAYLVCSVSLLGSLDEWVSTIFFMDGWSRFQQGYSWCFCLRLRFG